MEITRVCLFESLKYCLVRTCRHFACGQRTCRGAAAGMFITLKFQSTCCSQNRPHFSPSYFVFIMRSDDLPAAMKSDHLVLDSSCLRRACLSLFFACLPPKLLETNSKVRDICCLMLFFYYNCELCL